MGIRRGAACEGVLGALLETKWTVGTPSVDGWGPEGELRWQGGIGGVSP